MRSGHSCHLQCNKGYVTLDAKETVCSDGTWTQSLYCVKPGAMLIVGGRGLSGVLPSVELITSGGVCKNIVPDMPKSRWKMIAASVSEREVMACGGVNFLGDPKTECWRLDFSFNRPRWVDAPGLMTPRDAAAWAAESGKLYVMGGNLGPLSGYTDSVEVYNPAVEQWKVGRLSAPRCTGAQVGPSMTSPRASHCAVGVGDNSIIVTGGSVASPAPPSYCHQVRGPGGCPASGRGDRPLDRPTLTQTCASTARLRHRRSDGARRAAGGGRGLGRHQAS